MNFFKYVFYKSYAANDGERIAKESWAVIALSGCITFNIISIAALVSAYINYGSALSFFSIYTLGLFGLIYGIVWLLFIYKSRYKEVVEEYSEKPQSKSMQRWRLLYIILSPLLLIACLIIKREVDGAILRKEMVYTTAVITRDYKQSRSGWKNRYFDYAFEVNGKTYGHYCVYPIEVNKIHVGDSCKVVYARSNPEINAAIKDRNSEVVAITYRKPN